MMCFWLNAFEDDHYKKHLICESSERAIFFNRVHGHQVKPGKMFKTFSELIHAHSPICTTVMCCMYLLYIFCINKPQPYCNILTALLSAC